jgi:hypothetical protein
VATSAQTFAGFVLAREAMVFWLSARSRYVPKGLGFARCGRLVSVGGSVCYRELLDFTQVVENPQKPSDF